MENPINLGLRALQVSNHVLAMWARSGLTSSKVPMDSSHHGPHGQHDRRGGRRQRVDCQLLHVRRCHLDAGSLLPLRGIDQAGFRHLTHSTAYPGCAPHAFLPHWRYRACGRAWRSQL